MISRRIIRIKTMQVLYAYHKSSDSSINQFEKELFHSCQRFYDLFHHLILLMSDVVDLANEKIEVRKQKRIPTEEDLNPNMRFVENRLMQQITENESFKKYLNDNKLSWVNYPELVKNLLKDIEAYEYFKDYMAGETMRDSKYDDDKKLILRLFSEIFYNSEELYQALEEQSIYWNDDVDFVISMVTKVLKTFKVWHDQNEPLPPLFKNDDDLQFAKTLYRKAALNHSEHTKLIEKFTRNWDVDRIAFIDIVLLQMAITELIEFPSIPVKVTFNEYIELAKMYSTKRSNSFINGILDKIIVQLKEEERIKKQGRGLMDKAKTTPKNDKK